MISAIISMSFLCSIGTCYCCYKLYQYLDETMNDDEFQQMFDEYKRDVDYYYS
jgi:hypothetical protein